MAGKFVVLCCWSACLVFLVNINAMVPVQPGSWSELATVPEPMLNCGDNLCDCQNHVAFCSRQTSGLPVSYLPKLPAGITDVRFNGNGLTSQMMNETFFVNVSTISTLNLAENNLTVIHPSTFKVMRFLHNVDVSKNHHLTPNSLKVLLSISTLRALWVSDCSLGRLPSGVFNGISSRVQCLWLSMNNLNLLNLTEFSHLRFLVRLDVSSNAISDIIPDTLKKLSELKLKNNTLTKFPITCRNGVSLFPKLATLLLENNHIGTIGPDICLPELTSLDVSRNTFDSLDAATFSVTKFPKLQVLSFCYQHMQFRVQDYAFNNTSLWELNFANNNMKFLGRSDDDISGSFVGRSTHVKIFTPYISERAFQNCTNLNHLTMDNNDFGDIEDDTLHQAFGHLPLTYLSIKYCNFHSITPRTFSKFPLLGDLNLMGNKITSIPEGAFDTLKELRYLDLSSNRIATVHQDSFSEAMRTQLIFLALRGNPFICNCDLLWFKGWLQSSYSLFDWDHKCANIPGTSVTGFSMEEQACLLSVAVSVQVILTCSLLIVALTSSSLVFRYRWHIRLLLYEAFRGRDDVRRRLLENGNFRYDVFVSYASEQLPWVRQHLLPELEDRLGLKVCDHERDFIPGKNILDNIADCLESSKKMVMVFSKDFVISEWCQFELAVCLRHAMDHDDAPVIVCIDDVTSRNMTSAMIAVLKFTTYIQWEEEAHAVDSFWGRLRLALNDIVQHRNLDRQL